MTEGNRSIANDPASSPAILLSADQVAQAVYAGIRMCATTLRSDVFTAIQKLFRTAEADHPGSREASVLESIIRNANIAQERDVPLCQDTGSVWVCLEVGRNVLMTADTLSQIDEAVAQAYTEGGLRMSILADALFRRTNTNTNAPAFTEVCFHEGCGCKLHVMLKGGGSDNASRLVMLAPGAGREGVKQVVLDAVKEKAANACPPLIVGVGVGGTFDKVAGLSKRALLRKLDEPAESAEQAAFEEELLEAINALEIGPGALGGATTALGVHLKTAPCHIAALPVAVNLGCCALRSATFTLVDEDGNMVRHPAAESWDAEGRQ